MPTDVLVVEDEKVVRESAARILQSENLAVRLAPDAPTAIEELRRGSFALVLCDLMLPGDSGFAVLEASRDLRPQPQVVMVSGYATCENTLESFKRGAFDFLPKPFDVDELLATVTRTLRFVEGASSTPSPGSDGPEEASELYRLGRHAWAARNADGSATLGLGETFPGFLGTTVDIEISEPDRRLLQCRRCALIRSADGLTHRVWAPLSGRVIALNRSLRSEPARLDREPWKNCWLMRIVPESLAEEMSNLTRH